MKKTAAQLNETILHFLNNHRKMVLSLTDKNGRPTSSLLLYTIDDDLNFYFGTLKSFGKYEILLNNPNVAIIVVEETLDPMQVIDVIGTVKQVPEHKIAYLKKEFSIKNQSKSYIKDKEDFVMFKVKPTNIRFLNAAFGSLYRYDMPPLKELRDNPDLELEPVLL